MKKIILSMALIFIGTLIYAQSFDLSGVYKKVAFGGYVKNIQICEFSDNTLNTIKSIDLNKDYSYKVSLSGIEMNRILYIVSYGDIFPFYVKPGESLEIKIIDKQLEYIGTLSKENQVFSDWNKLMSPLKVFATAPTGKPAGDFEATIKNFRKDVPLFVSSINTGNKDFDDYAKVLLSYWSKNFVLDPFTYGMEIGHGGYKYLIDSVFYDEQFNDMKLWDLPIGFGYMLNYAFVKYYLYGNLLNVPTHNALINDIANPELKAEFVIKLIQDGFYTTDVFDVIDKYKGSMVTASQKERMNLIERRANVTKPGNAWEDFSYEDKDGVKHSLSDYLGKVVVVDVWATWCPPCLREIPSLQLMEKKYKRKNVVFLSVSFDEDKAKWMDYVTKEKLGGVQLISYRKGPIVDIYCTESVPRFMVFDKKGKTVNLDAPRPSSPALDELINQELNK